MAWSVWWSESTLNVDAREVEHQDWEAMLNGIDAALRQLRSDEVQILVTDSATWPLRGTMVVALRKTLEASGVSVRLISEP